MKKRSKVEIEMDDGDAEEHGIEPLGETEIDIKAAIDEAVHAVEESARRREVASRATESSASEPEIERLQAEIETLRDRSLRTLADFDNYRKRVERERDEERKYATQEVLREIVGIVDNLERASTAEGNLEDLRQGVEMIWRQLEDVLRRSGVAKVAAVGEAFDPSVHEAVSRVEQSEVTEPTVIEEFQAGYVVHDRLLRPSIVRVAVPAREAAAKAEAASAREDDAEESAAGQDSPEEAAG